MHSTLRPESAIGVAVRRTEWERRMRARGFTTTTAQGAALGVSHTTALRVAQGKASPSTSVIARSMTLLDARFEELFEITIDETTEHAAEVA